MEALWRLRSEQKSRLCVYIMGYRPVQSISYPIRRGRNMFPQIDPIPRSLHDRHDNFADHSQPARRQAFHRHDRLEEFCRSDDALSFKLVPNQSKGKYMRTGLTPMGGKRGQTDSVSEE
jgi:hypothetical protein